MKSVNWIVAGLLVVALTACQREDAAEPVGTSTQTSTTATQPAIPAADDVKLAAEEPIAVSVTDTSITLAVSPIPVPGATQFQVTNDGTMNHSLALDGPGVQSRLEAPLSPLEVRTLTADLQPGTYALYCPLDGHDQTLRTEVVVQTAP